MGKGLEEIHSCNKKIHPSVMPVRNRAYENMLQFILGGIIAIAFLLTALEGLLHLIMLIF